MALVSTGQRVRVYRRAENASAHWVYHGESLFAEGMLWIGIMEKYVKTLTLALRPPPNGKYLLVGDGNAQEITLSQPLAPPVVSLN